jgi:hypothetical protein
MRFDWLRAVMLVRGAGAPWPGMVNEVLRRRPRFGYLLHRRSSGAVAMASSRRPGDPTSSPTSISHLMKAPLFGADLRRAHVHGAHVHGAAGLSGADLRGADLGIAGLTDG